MRNREIYLKMNNFGYGYFQTIKNEFNKIFLQVKFILMIVNLER